MITKNKHIKLFFGQNSRLKMLPDLYPEFFSESSDPDVADFVIMDIREYSEFDNLNLKYLEKLVVVLNASSKQRNPIAQHVRKGEFVDELGLGENRINVLKKAALVFTTLDLDYEKHNFIGVPLSYNRHRDISQDTFYWKDEVALLGERNRVVYWKGNVSTHSTRLIVERLRAFDVGAFDFTAWSPKSSNGSPAAVYGKVKPAPQEYDNFMNQLTQSSVALVIRGDRPWVFSFFDVLRAGCVPIFIDAGYPKLGWENLELRPNDVFLSFNTKTDSPQTIVSSLRSLLLDDLRLDVMRKNIVNFYREFIQTDRYYRNNLYEPWLTGWGDFYAAKLLDRARGDFDNKFFSKTVFDVKSFRI